MKNIIRFFGLFGFITVVMSCIAMVEEFLPGHLLATLIISLFGSALILWIWNDVTSTEEED